MGAVPELPVSSDDRGHAVVSMSVRLNRRARGYEQEDGVEAGRRGITGQDLGVNPLQLRAPDLAGALVAAHHLDRRHADLRNGRRTRAGRESESRNGQAWEPHGASSEEAD